VTKKGLFFGFGFLFLWTFFVCYPNPLDLGKSVYRLFNSPVDEIAVAGFFEDLPEEPAEIENFIKSAVPYSHDWKTYGKPWYFPSTKEALLMGKGDCKTRFIILASVFEFLDIPYKAVFSPTHIWLEYEGKKPTKRENNEVAMIVADKERRSFSRPEIDIKHKKSSFQLAFLDPVPLDKKILFYQGLFFSLFIIYIERRVELLFCPVFFIYLTENKR